MYSYFVYFCWWEWQQLLEHFSFQEICTGITRVGFRLPNRVHFSLYKDEENIDQKIPLNLGKKLNVPGVRQLVLCKTEHWASEKGQMVSNKTVGLSNYWALCMQKLPSNIVLTYLSTEIQIYCSFFPHKNELLGISWEVSYLWHIFFHYKMFYASLNKKYKCVGKNHLNI